MMSEFRFRRTSPPTQTKETDQYDQGQECGGGGKVQSRRIAFPVAGDSVQAYSVASNCTPVHSNRSRRADLGRENRTSCQ